MKARAAALMAILLTISCSRGASANSVLAEVARNLDRIDSAEMSLRIEAAGGTKDEDAVKLVHELTGSFDLRNPAELPVAEITYRQTHGQEVAESTFLSDGKSAFVKVDDVYYRLPAERTQRLRQSEDGSRRRSLDLSKWTESATLSRERGLNKVRAEIDSVRAINDVIEFGRRVGAKTGSLARLEGDAAKQLRSATERATILVESTTGEHLLRRLRIDMSLVAPTEELKQALGKLGAAEMTFDLALNAINQPVRVIPPAESRDYSELQQKSQSST